MGPRHSHCILTCSSTVKQHKATSPPCLKAKANKPHLPPSESAERSARDLSGAQVQAYELRRYALEASQMDGGGPRPFE
jgi:hypothetical protein